MGLFSKAAMSFSQASQKLKFKVPKKRDVFYLCSGVGVGFAVMSGFRLKLESQAQRADGGSFSSYRQKKQDTPLEKFQANNPVGELSSTCNPVKSDFLRRSLTPIVMVTPIKVRSPKLSLPGQSLPGELRN